MLIIDLYTSSILTSVCARMSETKNQKSKDNNKALTKRAVEQIAIEIEAYKNHTSKIYEQHLVKSPEQWQCSNTRLGSYSFQKYCETHRDDVEKILSPRILSKKRLVGEEIDSIERGMLVYFWQNSQYLDYENRVSKWIKSTIFQCWKKRVTNYDDYEYIINASSNDISKFILQSFNEHLTPARGVTPSEPCGIELAGIIWSYMVLPRDCYIWNINIFGVIDSIMDFYLENASSDCSLAENRPLYLMIYLQKVMEDARNRGIVSKYV